MKLEFVCVYSENTHSRSIVFILQTTGSKAQKSPWANADRPKMSKKALQGQKGWATAIYKF